MKLFIMLIMELQKLNQMWKQDRVTKIFHLFFPRNFIVLGLFCLELIFAYGERDELRSFLFFTYRCLIVPASVVEKTMFSLVTFIGYISIGHICVSISGFFICLIGACICFLTKIATVMIAEAL